MIQVHATYFRVAREGT